MYDDSDTNCSYKEKRELVLRLANIESRLARIEEKVNHLEVNDGNRASADRIEALEKLVDTKVGKGEFAYVKYIVWTFSAGVVTGLLTVFFKLIIDAT